MSAHLAQPQSAVDESQERFRRAGSTVAPSNNAGLAREWGIVVALLLAPLLILIQELVTPIDHESDTSREMLAALGDESGRYAVSTTLLLAGMALMLPATVAIGQLIRGRGGWLGLTGGWITIFGLLMFCVNIGAMGLALTAIADLPANQRATQVPAVDAILDTKGMVWLPATAIVGLFLGPPLLAAGLWRSRAMPLWVVLLIPAGWWIFLMGPSHLLRALGPALLFVAFGVVAVSLLRPPTRANTSGTV